METHRFSVKYFPYISASTSMAELIKKDSVVSLLTHQSYMPFKGLDKPPYFLVLTPRDRDDLGRKLADCIYYDKGENSKCSDRYPDKNFYALFKLRRPSNFDDAVKVLTYGDIEDIINEVEKEKSSSGREVFPIVIIPKDSKLNPFSPYYRIKAELLSHNLVSQIVNVETISNPNTLRNSLLSIYVQLFVKAGGVPYLVSNSYILSDVNEYNIIIGYSLSRDPIRHKNAVGSIIVYNRVGQWLASEFVLDELPFNNKDKLDYYKQSLEDALMRAYKVAVNKNVVRSSQKVNVIVHYRGKELSTKEEQVILETIKKFRELNSSVYVLKIQQSDIILSATSKDYLDPDMYPPTGYYAKLLPDTFILQTVGKHLELKPRKDGKLSGNIVSGGTAKPILVSIKRFGDNENLELDSARREQLSIGLLSTVFALARINYVSVYKYLNSEPVTTRYARELAYIISRLGSKEIDGEMALRALKDGLLRDKMWFI
jgi:hypothetical protein